MSDLYLPVDFPADAWPDLPEPQFFERDPKVIEARLIARYEALAEKPLQPSQPERLMINVMAYEIALLNMRGERAARLNLLRYAEEPVLDLIGERVDTYRLLMSSALTTIRFAIDVALAFPVSVPAGSRVATADQLHVFATESAAEIPAGQTFVDVVAVAQIAGVAANGLVPGQIATRIDRPPYIVSAENVTESNSGADREDSERLRERIAAAPDRFSTAGPGEAYEWHVLSASQTIAAVAVLGPEDGMQPGEVGIYPLATTGLPSTELKTLVIDAVANDKKVRPLTDHVLVFDPVEIAFTVEGAVTPYADADANTVLAAATAAIEAKVAAMAAQLGTDIVIGQLERAAEVPGLYDIVLTAPAADQILTAEEWAHCTGVTLTLAPAEEG